MALAIDELNTTTFEAKLDQVATDQAYDESVFWAKKLSDGFVKQKGGKTLDFGIHYQTQGTGAMGNPRSQITFENVETITGASTYWSYYNARTMIFMDEKIKNAGKSQAIDLVADRVGVLKREILNTLCTALFSTGTPAGTFDLQPIPYIVDSANTYAGIAVADAANWASQENSTTTTLSVTGQYSLSYYNNLCSLGTKKPGLYLTTRDLASKAMSLLMPNVWYQDKTYANLGFSNVTLIGIPVIGDAFVAAGMWLGLDMDSWEVVVNSEQGDKGIGYSPWIDLTPSGYLNTSAKIAYFVGQVRCMRRRTNFKYTALDYNK
jgi:hypothetical protein